MINKNNKKHKKNFSLNNVQFRRLFLINNNNNNSRISLNKFERIIHGKFISHCNKVFNNYYCIKK